MKIKAIQFFIDKYRNKPPSLPLKAPSLSPKEILLNEIFSNGFTLENNIWIFPDNMTKMENTPSMDILIGEIFLRKDYDFDIDKNFIAIDMGMNKATTSIFFALKENTVKVFGYEPFLKTYEEALKNIQLNPHLINKIETFPFGLSDKNTFLEIPYCDSQNGSMSLTNPDFNLTFESSNPNYLHKVEVRSATQELHKIIEKYSEYVIIAKIDTEGSEFAILRDLDESGILQKIDVIFMEFHFKCPEELINRLKKNDFIVIKKWEGTYKDEILGFLTAFKLN